MNFKLARFCYVVSSFITGSFFLIFGVFSMALPWFPYLQNEFARLITDHALIISLFGIGLALIGLSIVIYSFFSLSHRYAVIRTGDLAVTLDRQVIYQYLDSYWTQKFPQTNVTSQVKIKKRSLQIFVDLPPLPIEERSPFLDKVKQDFTDIFGRLLGYPHKLQLIAKFSSDKKQ